jgi:hypothetical protein
MLLSFPFEAAALPCFFSRWEKKKGREEGSPSFSQETKRRFVYVILKLTAAYCFLSIQLTSTMSSADTTATKAEPSLSYNSS